MTAHLVGVRTERSGATAARPHPDAGPTRFGGTLQTARRRAGLTQEQLAAASGVSIRAIRDLELGRAQRPRKETIRLLADALGLTGSHRVLLDGACGHSSADTTLRQMYAERNASVPAAMGPLIGRERELEVLARALLGGQDRMLSLVGLPGVGKSRLALAVAHRYEAEREARVVWLPARHGGDATPAGPDPGEDSAQSLLTSWMLDRLSGPGPLDELARLIGQRRTLLVVDGYEHDPGDTVGTVDHSRLVRLLAACDRLQVLVTTRAPLPVLGARVVPIGPLPLLPPFGEPGSAPAAVRLMASHVGYARPALQQTAAVTEAVTGLCGHLDGIPLALNLAAGWLPMYSPDQLFSAARDNPLHLVEPVFDGEFGGHPDLAALIRGAVTALRPAQSRALAALALMDGPCPTEEVRRRLGGPPQETLRAVHGLLLRGLIREERVPGGTTVSVLNLVRHTLHADSESTALPVVARL
ncbi:helix-turn-helix domain-containing protein [Streptomyces sp. McG3]|uniref:helix-turn-helix domain-containing protein n=1 Tax=unclassified Streptomyces TaxID=2593676 RepID=UPI001BE6CCAC|nr:helix-turn-helix domain-containing protein [Streptomyces sp. McG3]MBT2898862.1 XRE family transcriptional regulator [Streptomyces sp. McG3]